ncbi:acyltransferase [Haloferacaceae archaeon DSL9]
MIRTYLSEPRRNRLLRRLLFNRVAGSLGEYLTRAARWNRYASYRNRYDVDPDFRFNGPGITLYGRGDIELGADSYIGRHSRIQSKDDQRVRVGENTAISHFVFVYTVNREPDQDMSRDRNDLTGLSVSRGDVDIGEDCWIGAFTFVTEGTVIGDDTVVGAHSVVTRDLPPHAIAVGAPAQVTGFKSFLSTADRIELAEEYWDVLSPSLRERLAADS